MLNLFNDEEDEGQLYTRCELCDLIDRPVETRYSFRLNIHKGAGVQNLIHLLLVATLF